jgi:nuclease S1
MLRRAPCHLWFTLVPALLVSLQTATPAFAWGHIGHRGISRLTEKQLTPTAKAAIAELLEPGESLADASTWADEVRGRMRHTAPWQYVDVPLDEPRYDSKYSGEKIGCVVDKINEFRKVIGDNSRSIEDRRFALRFLVHCLQDVHQPCHVGDNSDKGGNDTQVRWFDRGSNMHRVWDGGIIERAGTTEEFWLADLAALDTPENRAAWMTGTPEDWATESLLAAREAYQDPKTGNRIKSGTKLSDEYQAKNVPVVRQRMVEAGVRLAMVLNEAFSAQ